jgi:hypothetical protein
MIVGQEYEMRRRDEAGEFWSRVCIVRDNGTAVWVKYAGQIGNSFPVSLAELRPLRVG